MNKNRPNKVTFRLSDSELEKLRAQVQKSGFNEQQFLTRVVFSKSVIEKEALHELIYQIRKIGINCNQIARACNSGNASLESDRIKQLATSLEEICQSLRQ